MTRIHILIEEDEKERFRAQAAREGKSLAEWLREAGRDRLEAADERPRLETVEELRAFFEACAAREVGREPDWGEHRQVIERSIGSGAGE